MTRPLKMRWILTCVTAVFLLAVTPAGAQDYETTRRAAEQGNAEAQGKLGQMYMEGRGVPQDDAEAVRWFRLAAEQGVAVGQVGLGMMYGGAGGRVVPRDDAEAVRWFRLAAEQGDAGGQVFLGWLYASGRGEPQDQAEAARWLRLAEEQGFASVWTNLLGGVAGISAVTGVFFELGFGVPQDYATAVRLYRLAAEQGDATAQGRLGLMYAAGRGVPQDYAEAVRWYRLAAEQGDASAQSYLEEARAAGRVPDIILHGLQLSEGAPEPGFTFSALAGALPVGNVSLTPAFEPGSTTYRAEVSQPLLTIRARAVGSVNFTATGVTADGRALPIVNQTKMGNANDHGAFLSVTFSELAMGENRIQIALSPAGTAYTIVVTRSAPD